MVSRSVEGAVNLLRTCANVKPNEQVLIVTDWATEPAVAKAIVSAASLAGVEAITVTMQPRALPGDEPPPPVVAAMLSANVVICPTSRTLYHTNARTMACRKGARFISMAGATSAVLASKAMLANFPRQKKTLSALMRRLTHAKRIRVTNPAGTDLQFNVQGREGRGVSGMATRSGDATAVPDIEAYIAPREEGTTGVLVVDGSVSVTGVVTQAVRIRIEHGYAQSITGGTDARKLRQVLRDAKSHASYRVGEFGIGLNPLASIRGSIIEDEGKLGTAHVALGDNIRLGGKNKAPTHIDLVIKKPHIEFDGVTILDGKRLTL